MDDCHFHYKQKQIPDRKKTWSVVLVDLGYQVEYVRVAAAGVFKPEVQVLVTQTWPGAGIGSSL